jgi:hypothetical protein
MPAFNGTSFQDRQKTASEARKALLEKFKARPAEDDPVVIEREAQRREIAAAREARAAEREAKRLAEAEQKAREDAERAARTQAQLEAEAREREATSLIEAKEREIAAQEAVQAKALLEIEKKAERDARYAARKGRKAQAKSEERRYR